MYVGSWGVGLAAVLILMAFRPFPQEAGGDGDGVEPRAAIPV